MASSDRGSSEFDIDYQYPDDQGESGENFDFTHEPSSEKKPGALSKLPKKKIMILIGMGVVLFAVFQVLTPKDEESARVPQPAAKEQPATKALEEKKETTAQAVRQPEIQLAPVQVSTSDTTQI